MISEITSRTQSFLLPVTHRDHDAGFQNWSYRAPERFRDFNIAHARGVATLKYLNPIED